MQRDSLPSSELCRLFVGSIQLEISRVDAGGGVDSQRELKLFPPPREDLDELNEPPFPNGPRKNFDKELSPESTVSRNEKFKYGVCSPEIRIASVCTLLDVFRDSFAKLLHSSLNRLTARRDLLDIGHIFQPRSRAIREIHNEVKMYTHCTRTAIMSFILKFVRRRRLIEIRRDVLSVERQNPLVVFKSFRLERVYSLEREDGDYGSEDRQPSHIDN